MANPVDWQRKTSTLLADGTSLNSPYEHATTAESSQDYDSCPGNGHVEITHVTGKGIILAIELLTFDPNMAIVFLADDRHFRTVQDNAGTPWYDVIHEIKSINDVLNGKDPFFTLGNYDTVNNYYYLYLHRNVYFNTSFTIYVENTTAGAKNYAITWSYRTQ